MTRDTYDLNIRRASQLSQKLDLFKPNLAARRPSKTPSILGRASSLHRENLQSSHRTLVSLDSNNSSRSNVNTVASSSCYSSSNADLRYPRLSVTDNLDLDDDDFDDDDDDDLDDDDGLGSKTGDSQGGNGDNNDDESDDKRRNRCEELPTDKGLYDRKIHYILLGFGAVFGVRNIMEFPALAIEHGGGAFLFVYVTLTYFVALPIVYLEVSLGQYSRGGVVQAWRILPLAKGIAISSLLLTLAMTSYSLTPAAWSIYYLYSAVANWLPLEQYLPTIDNSSTDINHTSKLTVTNVSAFYLRPVYSISHHHFFNATLEITDSISSMGHVVFRLFVCMVVLWAVIFLLASLGPQYLSRVSFCFTAVPAVLMLAVLFIVACTLPGSVNGIQHFLNPRWYRLSSFKPWLDALDLVMSGLACGTGILITFSGHCNFHGNTFRNAMAITNLSLAITILSGCMMLALLGVEAVRANVPVENITNLTDYDLGFVLLPTATTQMPKPELWSGIFFAAIMLFSIAQGTVAVQHMHQGALDLLKLREGPRKWRLGVLGAIVAVLVAINIFTTAQNGLYVVRLLQLSVTRLTTPLLSAAQCVIVGWGYGARRFAGRVLEMTGRNKSVVWKWLWRWGCPVFLSLVSVASLLTSDLLSSLPPVDRDKKWLHGLGWALNPLILLPGVTLTLISLCSVPGTLKQRMKQLRTTPSDWGPGHPEHEPQADLPDYVICHPDPFRPANALAMLTANLYLPNIINLANGRSSSNSADMAPSGGYLSAAAGNTAGSDDEGSFVSSASDASSSRDGPERARTGLCGRCHATVLCLSHVIGLGNVVRFPYLAYRHGGGSFLIAYFLLLVICGLPLVILETAIGQYSCLGPIRVWRAVPIFKGIGYAMMIISVVTSVYYGVITSWSVLYLVTSMTSVTPWEDCNNVWNTNSCITIETREDLCQSLNSSYWSDPTNTTGSPDSTSKPDLVQGAVYCHNRCYGPNCTGLDQTDVWSTLNSSVAEYFYRSVVRSSDDWGEAGDLSWQLSLCLLTVWAFVALTLVKGIKPGERATYFILGLTFTILFVLFVRASSLSGGNDGLRYLFTPQLASLATGHLWRDAATQVFFSLSLGSGTLVTMGTFNKFSNNIFTEAGLILGVDSLISLMSSLVVFSVLGAFAHATGQPVEFIAKPDLGLPFLAMSHATLHLPWPLFWSVMTFLTLTVCGVASSAGLVATAVTSVVDVVGGQLKKQKVWLVLGLTAGGAIVGLLLMLQIGFQVVDTLDRYLSGLPEIFTSGLVVSAFAWVYGVNRISGDISRMIHSPVNWWWRAMWVCVCPGLTLILIICSLTSLFIGESDSSLKQPRFTSAIGMVPLCCALVPVFVCAIHEISRARSGTFIEKLRRACQTRREWGATEHRCNSRVEYYPTVHTHMGIDISVEGLNTITDRVDFSAVGVRLPSLSQTTLLPVSPGMQRVGKMGNRAKNTKKPKDMRHRAILNHAYSNPQCNISSGSLESAEKRKRGKEEITKSEKEFVVKRKKRKVPTSDASTQTDPHLGRPALQRQRSQPTVRVTERPPPSHPSGITRSWSWHQLGQGHLNGQPAILKVDAEQLFNGKANSHNLPAVPESKPDKTIRKPRSSSSNSLSASECPEKPTRAAKLKKMKSLTTFNSKSLGNDRLIYSSDDTKPEKPKRNKFHRSLSCDDYGEKLSCHRQPLSTTKGARNETGMSKKRRCGCSTAPNLDMLMQERQLSCPLGDKSLNLASGCHGRVDTVSTLKKSKSKSTPMIFFETPLRKSPGARPKSCTPSTSSADIKCADTVVRLSDRKSGGPEVCALPMPGFSDTKITSCGNFGSLNRRSISEENLLANRVCIHNTDGGRVCKNVTPNGTSFKIRSSSTPSRSQSTSVDFHDTTDISQKQVLENLKPLLTKKEANSKRKRRSRSVGEFSDIGIGSYFNSSAPSSVNGDGSRNLRASVSENTSLFKNFNSLRKGKSERLSCSANDISKKTFSRKRSNIRELSAFVKDDSNYASASTSSVGRIGSASRGSNPLWHKVGVKDDNPATFTWINESEDDKLCPSVLKERNIIMEETEGDLEMEIVDSPTPNDASSTSVPMSSESSTCSVASSSSSSSSSPPSLSVSHINLNLHTETSRL